MYAPDDTIAAIATPAGRGGLGVVRVSGPRAHAVAAALLGLDATGLEPRRATFGRVELLRDGRVVPADQVVSTFFPGPHSYTGEDVVEISAHGNPVVLEQIVAAATAAGARLARPGEFTFRAFLSGRIDLVQAEAIADLIEAVTPAQARVAFDQLDGRLTGALQSMEQRLLDLVARLEASLDFPEEDYHFITPEELSATLRSVREQIAGLRGQARAGRLLREGAQVVITGTPNVGKSSLFNLLLGAGRAIVTAQPGTTRDLIAERVDVHGIPVTLVDTAGLRDAPEDIEAEGVARARRASETAALRLLVLDRSREMTDADLGLLKDLRSMPRVVVANKTDLPAAWSADGLGVELLGVSARTGKGVEALRSAIASTLGGYTDYADAPAISNLRHVRLLDQADAALERAAKATGAGASEEFVLQDLRDAMQAFDQIVGQRTPSDVLETIFSRFCIGK
ncbi:MAG: tRNA uridine-5-carboxymethylaminomethyl(34) synthesis GTPase MnmE [Vicinamibacterales bacterium]